MILIVFLDFCTFKIFSVVLNQGKTIPVTFLLENVLLFDNCKRKLWTVYRGFNNICYKQLPREE